MQTSTTNRRTWLWLAVLLLLFIVISYFTVSKDAEEYPGYVSNSPSPTGVKAFYTYMDQGAGSVNRWSASPEHLTKQDDNQLLMMVEPFFIPDQRDMESYVAFMKAGNTILLLKDNPEGMFGLKTDPLMEELKDEEAVEGIAGEDYHAEKLSPVRMRVKETDEVLLQDAAGAMAIKRSYGSGDLIVANSPDWITNDKILDMDHLQLLFSLLEEQNPEVNTILFDEYSHATGNASSIDTLYPRWLLVIGLQGLLLTVLMLWHQGKRFGPVLVARDEMVRFSDERVKALAAWYQKGKRYHDSLNHQADYVKLLLQERWGIPYYKEWQDIDEQMKRKRKHLAAVDVDEFLTGLTSVLKNEHVNKKDYLKWSERIDQLRREVEEDEK